MAAKTVLPLALSQLANYAGDCIRVLAHYAPPGGVQGAPPPPVAVGLDVPNISPEVIGTLRECVRSGSDEVIGQIATLLAKIQIQQARLNRLFARSAKQPNHQMSRFEAIGAMIDAAEIHAKASALFEYGREVADLRTKSPIEGMKLALFESGISDLDDPELYKVLDSRYPATDV